LRTADVPVKLNLNLLRDITIALQGQVHHPAATPEIEARLEIAEFSLRQLFKTLEQPLPVQTADPKTLERIAVQADIKGNAAGMKLSGGELTLDDSKLAMDLEVKDFARPDLTFDIDLDQIDLDRYLPPPGEPAGEQASSPGSSPQKADYTPLRRLIADGRLKIGQLTVKKVNARDILVQVRAQNGVIRLDPLKLSMYQGNVAGAGRLDVSGDKPQTNFDLQVQNVQVNPLMRDAVNKDFLEGRTNAKIVLSMIGDDADSIKRSLNGSGDLLFNDGAIKGIDLANMVRTIKAAITLEHEKKDKEKPRTDFAELSVPFTIRNGVFETPSSSLKSPLVRLEAVGKADLVAETLNFRVDPKLVATIKGQGDEQERSGVMVPIAVSGSFASPKFRPDLEGAAKQQLVQDLIKSKNAEEAKSAGDQLKNSAQDFLKGVLKKKE
jgi:AsmA protein